MVEYQIHDQSGFLHPFPEKASAGDTLEIDGGLYQVKGCHWDTVNGKDWRCCILVQHFGENV